MIAQIDKQHAAMIAFAVNPTGQADCLANIGSAQLGASVGAVCVHDQNLAEKSKPRLTTAPCPFVKPRASAMGYNP
jgi:uncharacterized metal-binding protein